ncbi:MAG: SMP-30/gluconolactonase/LRE family protein [Actinomycetota bacterium]
MADLETLTHGYGLVEGPRVDEAGNLYFSDVLDGGVYRRDPSGTIDTVVPKRRGVGGIALHADGGIVISGRNVCHVVDGETRVVFEPDAPGCNDLVTDASGRVLTGTIRRDPFDAEAAPTAGEAYRIGLDGSVERLYDDVGLTNGLGFSPAGDRLYHSDSTGGHVICHDIETGPAGVDRLTNRRALRPFRGFQPDGLAVDEAGTIWVADFGAGAVIGVSPDGDEVDRIPVPATAVTSVCFGGPDRRDLYIVTADNRDDPDRRGTIFLTRSEVPGLAIPAARV